MRWLQLELHNDPLHLIRGIFVRNQQLVTSELSMPSGTSRTTGQDDTSDFICDVTGMVE